MPSNTSWRIIMPSGITKDSGTNYCSPYPPLPCSVVSSDGASASAECSVTIVARLPEITVPFFGQYGDATRQAGAGQLRPLARTFTRTFERRLRLGNGHSRADRVRHVVSLCGRWGKRRETAIDLSGKQLTRGPVADAPRLTCVCAMAGVSSPL